MTIIIIIVIIFIHIIIIHIIIIIIIIIIIVFSVARRRRGQATLKYRCICREKFDIACNGHGRTDKCNFSVFDLKLPFWENFG